MTDSVKSDGAAYPESSMEMGGEEGTGRKGIRADLYKTQLCTRYTTKGSCHQGDNCVFAHGTHEVRPVHMTWEEFKKKITDNPRYKTVRCSFFLQHGYCTNDRTCDFAHDDRELRTMDPNYIKKNLANQGGTKRKTDMCKNWLRDNHCPMGDACSFSHGVDMYAQQPALDQEKLMYKTAICNNFKANSECPHGDKCHFAHGQAELRTTQDNKAMLLQERQAAAPVAPMRNPAMSAAPIIPGGPNDPNLFHPERLKYKTSLCRQWSEKTPGQCYHGEDCAFAHGEDELRTTAENKKMIEDQVMSMQQSRQGMYMGASMPPPLISGGAGAPSAPVMGTQQSTILNDDVLRRAMQASQGDRAMSYEEFLRLECNDASIQPPPSYVRYKKYLTVFQNANYMNEPAVANVNNPGPAMTGAVMGGMHPQNALNFKRKQPFQGVQQPFKKTAHHDFSKDIGFN